MSRGMTMVGVTYQHKAEATLKRADELIAVGQKNTAYQNLHEMIMNSKKQMKNASYTSLEPIAMKYVELSVELKRSKAVREALHQYKNVCVNVNVNTLETVLRHLLDLAEQKVNEAQKKAEKLALDAVEDLEAAETPESVMLSCVSSEDTKDRTDRSVVLPWLRFLWEAYRIALDILKLNARLESMYQSVAQNAFQFCLKYNRRNEFRKLCETLRNHLSLVGKSQKVYQIDLGDPQSLQSHLDTRFAQLNRSVRLKISMV
jgi:translation initiation factor 3 subunit A